MPKRKTASVEPTSTSLAVVSIPQPSVPPQFHPFYVGIDIGYKFHVMAIIPAGAFVDPKQPWKKAKTVKFNSDAPGLTTMLAALENVSRNPADFCIVMEPTGGHYGFTLMRVLQKRGYYLFQVENRAVREHRDKSLGITEKSDQIDARVMAQMAFQRVALPGSMAYVRTMTPLATSLTLFRTLVRDRWLLNTQLTRRKNQVLQLFSVTNPNLKSVFATPSRPSVMKLALRYPTAEAMAKAAEEDLRQALIEIGAKTVARKAARHFKELESDLIQVDTTHLVTRQAWLIEDALRLQQTLESLDAQIHDLLWGYPDKGLPAHPYSDLLFSLPVVSDIWAATLIGVIGDVDRFENVRQFTKYLGFSPKGEKSGTSVDKRRLDMSGVRDSRRVLFQMALVMLLPKVHNVFKAYYERLVARGMPKMRALGHVCGKISHVIYAMLREGKPYDPRAHAAACGVAWDDRFLRNAKKADPTAHQDEAEALAEALEAEGTASDLAD